MGVMDLDLASLVSGVDARDVSSTVRHVGEVVLHLGGASVLGGLQGLEREWLHKPAGLRTHMLVALGAAVFVLAPREAGMANADLSRVIQGVAAGVGFIGAGTILKITATREIEGLTTAASLWLAAAVGLAVGAGLFWVPVLSSVLALGILTLANLATARMRSRSEADR
jgi:putative Mg2+ transporter-C (MgtC) family protein